MIRRGALAWRLLAALAALAPAAPAPAHPLAPSLLEVRERSEGRIEVLWKTPLARPAGVDLRPELPGRCQPVGEAVPGGEGTAATLRFVAECGPGGLVGLAFGVRGLVESRTDALLRFELADGRSGQAVLGADAPVFTIPERVRPLQVARQYAQLGFLHILEGVDHLLFVFGLMLLVRGWRMLAWTITSFTVGHSITLSLAALGFLGLPQAFTELAISASILVLAVELARPPRPRPSLLRRRPWLVAGLFGLLHGLGFAGALAELGLPAEEIPVALVSFNVGIELGQLAFVAAVIGAGALLQPLRGSSARRLDWVPAYAIGSLAAYFCISRVALLL